MPKISFSLKDLNKLVGRSISVKRLDELIHFAKGELEAYDKKTGEALVSLDDTNLPYLWSVEGLARLFRGVLGVQKGMPGIKVKKGKYDVVVSKNVKSIRPYIACFVALGKGINDHTIKQMVQLQEKLCENYGRKRQNVSIGLYSFDRINFPVHYKAVKPEEVSFIPLESKKKMNLRQILKSHPKGKDYAFILEGFKKYPILMDYAKEVLSFPPIINSNYSGKIEVGDKNLFFEVTGTDEAAVNLMANIFAYALYERGFKIYSVNVKYPNKKLTTPSLSKERMKIKKEYVKELIGLELKENQIKRLLEKAGYNFKGFVVEIPPYRKDILHWRDIVEDIAIMYGFSNVKPLPMKSHTTGSTLPLQEFIDKTRNLAIGLGYQEIISAILTNKELLYKKMNISDFGTVEIANYMSKNYSVVRSWLIPVLMDFLSRNTHVEYPQKVFEQGPVNVRKANQVAQHERIALVSAHASAGFTEMKQALDFIMRSMGVKKYEIKTTNHDSFIPGRVARVSVKNKKVAYIGEIHPKVLENFGLEMPVAALELNLSELFEVF
jgi:phenylalanyl-tRNA synthetase beta chain